LFLAIGTRAIDYTAAHVARAEIISTYFAAEYIPTPCRGISPPPLIGHRIPNYRAPNYSRETTAAAEASP